MMIYIYKYIYIYALRLIFAIIETTKSTCQITQTNLLQNCIYYYCIPCRLILRSAFLMTNSCRALIEKKKKDNEYIKTERKK